MAVAHITFPDRRAARATADALEKTPAAQSPDRTMRYAAREIRRAADRPGLKAELGADELRLLVPDYLDLLPPRVRPLMAQCREDVEAGLLRDKARIDKKNAHLRSIRAKMTNGPGW